ncbi:MAG: hypothetical protein JWP12_1039 [Bacteroidetes bacterium]|nr:hypothetical protein [Bacteroidota bacterium]
MKQLFCTLTLAFIFTCAISQTSYTWNGTTSTAWNVNTNWTPNGIPGVADNITIVTGSNNCNLNADTSITNITITSGTLNLGNFTLTSTGNVLLTSGTVNNGTLTVNAGTANTATLTNTIFSSTAILNITTGTITLNGGTYGNSVSLNQIGATQTTGTGNAIFNGSFTMTNSGSNNFRINGNCTFNGAVTYNNSGTGYLLPELTTGNTYNSALSINNTNTSNIRMCYNGTTNFNSNIIVSNTGGGNVYFGEQPAAICNLSSGNTLTTGGAGFTTGNLFLYRLKQLGGTAQNIVLTGTAQILILQGSVFSGDLIVTSPTIALSKGTYNGTAIFNKNGSTNDATAGGNTFNSTLTVNHTGSGYFSFGNGIADIYNGDVYANNTGTERIIFGHNSPANQFNGNVYVSQSGTGVGISLGWTSSPSTTVIMAAGKSIFIGAGGFTNGFLQMYHLQQLDATAINLTTTGTSSIISYQCTFTGAVTLTAPDIFPYGGTYNAAANFTKTGGTTGNHNNGNQNIFNAPLTINQQSSTGYFLLGFNSNDLFNDNIIVNSTGSGGISFGWASGTGTPTLAAGKTISVGGAGFSAGYLQFGTFTQLGTAANTLNLTGTSSFYIVNSTGSCVFGGPLDITAPDLYIRGGTFNGATTFTKTGGGSDHNNGVQNIFNAPLTINQQSNTGYFLLGYNSNDLFNDNIIVTSTGSSGIYLGWTSGTGTPTLASGKTITIGAAGFSSGFLQFGSFTQLGTTPISLTFTGTAYVEITFASFNSNFGGDFTTTAPDIYVRGGTFNGVATFTKTGGAANHNNGIQNLFNSTCVINQQSNTGYFMLGYNANDMFNGDITVTSTGTAGIYLGWSGGGTGFPVLASGKTVLVGAAGFNAGFLQFNQFTQLGSAPINLTFTGATTSITFAHNSVFGGNFTSATPDIYFNGATFNGAVNATKTGSVGDFGYGGNVFNAVSTFVNSGAGFLVLGNTLADIWNGDATFTNTGTERILPGWNSPGNQFNGNIFVNSSGSALGINFCGSGLGSATIAATKTIMVGTSYDAGYLILQKITQLGSAAINLVLSSTASYIQYGPSSTLGGNVTSASPGLFFNGCTFNGAATCTKTGASNDASIGNNIYNGVTSMNNAGSGYLLFGNGNSDQFNTTTAFNNTGSSHIYVSYNSSNNIFGGVVTFNNSPTAATSMIYVANTGANNSTFNDNIIVNCNNGNGISFGSGTGTTTLSTGKTISTGAGVFNNGSLTLKNFTQVGGTAQNITTTAASTIVFGPSSTFNGNVTTLSPGLFFNDCTFNGAATCTKNGASNDGSVGNNIFNGITTMNNIGSGYLLFGNGNSDQFNTTTAFNNTGSSHIYVSYNSSNNIFGGVVTFNNSPTAATSMIYVANTGANNSTFNDNIIVNCNNGNGISFGSATGTTTLSAGKTISTGAGVFNNGSLTLKNFTQVGGTVQNITTTAASTIVFGPSSSFDGNITTVSPGVLFNGCTFNGAATSTKNGSSNNSSNGSNIFNGTTTLTVNNTGYLVMANALGDTYNADVTFVQISTGRVYPNYNAACNYFGNVTVTSPAATAITFGSNVSGVAIFTGAAAQSINKTAGSANPVFTRLVMNKASNAVTLNTRINISATLTMTSGNINTTSVNILNMDDLSATTIGNALSYVNGPMNYDMAFSGVRILNFPIGKVNDWRPAVLTLTHSTATSYTYNAEVFNANAEALGWALPATVDTVSFIHYWDINRTATAAPGVSVPLTALSGNQIITLYFDTNDGVRDGANLTICKNKNTALTTWFDIGGAGAPPYAAGAYLSGSITSTSSPTAFNSFSRFTLGSKLAGWNPLPIELLYFTASLKGAETQLDWATATETNNDHFEIEKSNDAIIYNYLTSITAAGSGNSTSLQEYRCMDEHPFNGITYYRLKQVDKDGTYVYSAITSVESNNDNFISFYPNPTKGLITVNASESFLQSDISIVDESGKQVAFYHGIPVLNGQIDLSGMTTGLYYINVYNGSTIERTKIVLQE